MIEHRYQTYYNYSVNKKLVRNQLLQNIQCVACSLIIIAMSTNLDCSISHSLPISHLQSNNYC